jgi:hypothetical protein
MQSRRAQRSSFFTTTVKDTNTPVGPMTFDEWKTVFSYNGGPSLSTGLQHMEDYRTYLRQAAVENMMQHPSLTTNFVEIIMEINAARDIPTLEVKARELDELSSYVYAN